MGTTHLINRAELNKARHAIFFDMMIKISGLVETACQVKHLAGENEQEITVANFEQISEDTGVELMRLCLEFGRLERDYAATLWQDDPY